MFLFIFKFISRLKILPPLCLNGEIFKKERDCPE
jgi:hypothetical protein